MTLTRSLIFAILCLISFSAIADEAPDPPPNFGDCTARAQKKKTSSSECQECNNIYQDGCEKKFKGTDLVRKCQIKPAYSGEWREVWCKAPATKTEEPASKAVEPTTTAATIAPASTKAPEVKAPEPKTQEAPKETPRVAAETTKEAGCAVDPNAETSWLLLALFMLMLRRNKKENS